MNHPSFTAGTRRDVASTQFLPNPPLITLNLSAMATANIFVGLQLLVAAALLHDSNTSQIAGYGVLGVLTGSALGMLVATSAKNRMPWRIWGRRFAAYFLSGLIVTAALIVITAHMGVEPSLFLAFACGGFGGFLGLSVVLVAEKRAKERVEYYLDEEDQDNEPIKPLGPDAKTIRLCPDTKKIL